MLTRNMLIYKINLAYIHIIKLFYVTQTLCVFLILQFIVFCLTQYCSVNTSVVQLSTCQPLYQSILECLVSYQRQIFTGSYHNMKTLSPNFFHCKLPRMMLHIQYFLFSLLACYILVIENVSIVLILCAKLMKVQGGGLSQS